jgi:hypothetical protein
MENTQINPFDFGYNNDQVVMIPANNLLSLMYFATKVKEKQPEIGVLYEYPDTVENKRDEQGNLIESNVTWKEYAAEEANVFFANVNRPIRISTELSVLADQVLFSLGAIHEKNINAGVAVNLKDEQSGPDISQILAQSSKSEN